MYIYLDISPGLTTLIENLYLETAALPIDFILTSRRLIYLKQILDREEEEITKKMYRCQMKYPVLGDWCELIKKDFDKIKMNLSEKKTIEDMPVLEFKKLVKLMVRKSAFKYLEDL